MRADHLGGLDRCDMALTNMAALLWPLTPHLEDDKGFDAWGRTSGMLRAGFEDGDAEGIRSSTLAEEESQDYNG
eukprot:CAMPEP_0204547052 /NCGR_PEP_ID=MMETSP0661-20131031/22513_1 /ASSEMBLY_ACC=CAM_ASM_000606 /TAXON_ID=109239 /ORGANISM="Alexandrium margalefi, Strain AMGDE01CS-322" /LENGTH=73 /DNA_ID=CAMNT_0051553913 /DNA_START=47 /DNA_END=265 /DNA_ORIENTATION=+